MDGEGLEVGVLVEVNDVEVIGGGLAEVVFLEVEVTGNDAEVGGGAALRTESEGFVGGVAGLDVALEAEEGTGAIEEGVGFPGGVVLDVEEVRDGGEGLGEFGGFDESLGEVAPDFLLGGAGFVGVGDDFEETGGGLVVAGVVGLHTGPLHGLLGDVLDVFPPDGEVDLRGEALRVLGGKVGEGEEQAGVFRVGFGAEGAGGVEERGGFLGLVGFHHAPADPVVRLGLEIVGEVIDLFQQALVADEHVLDVAFLAAGAGGLEPGQGDKVGRRDLVGGEAVEVGDGLGRLTGLGVGLGALHEGGMDALVIRIFCKEIGQRADGTLSVSRFGEAPTALVEEAGAVRIAEAGGVDFRVVFGGLGGLVFREERLRFHQHRGVDAGVFGMEFPVDLEEGVHLIDDVLALDLEEAVEAVVGGLEGEVVLGFDEALDLA